MEPFTRALDVVTTIMRDGAASHPNNDWIGRPIIRSAVRKTTCASCMKAISSKIIWRMPLRVC